MASTRIPERERLRRLTCAAGVGLVCLLAVARPAGVSAAQYIEAYTDRMSYAPGDCINFQVSTVSPTFSITILRDNWSPQTIASVSGLAGHYYPVPAQEGWLGADWPVCYVWPVPVSWRTGSYLAKFRTEDGTVTYFPFIVREPVPGSRGRVAFLMNYDTRNAYNVWGGKSLYMSLVPGDTRHAVEVSFARPFYSDAGRGAGYSVQRAIHSKLEADGFALEYLTEWDVHADPSLLEAYDVLVLACHHEYISRPLYDAMLAHHARGAHLAFFSANDLWWQVRFEDDGETMVCYKDYAIPEDPLYGVQNELVTTLWGSWLLGRPGEALQGIRYQNYSYQFEAADYAVQAPTHWAFSGTGLVQGQSVGGLVAAGETDYLGPASPPVVDVLLTSRRDDPLPGYSPPVDHVDCAAIYYERSPAYGFPTGLGGEVFAVGTEVGWGSALPGNPYISRITWNVMRHMVDHPPVATRVAESAGGATPHLRAEPNPFRAQTEIQCDVLPGAVVTVQVYDLAGRLVRTLLRREDAVSGRLAVRWDGRDEAGRRMAPGVYFCRLATGDGKQTRPLVLIR